MSVIPGSLGLQIVGDESKIVRVGLCFMLETIRTDVTALQVLVRYKFLRA